MEINWHEFILEFYILKIAIIQDYIYFVFIPIILLELQRNNCTVKHNIKRKNIE